MKTRKKFGSERFSKNVNSKGEFHLLVNELRSFDHELFFVSFRMSQSSFGGLLSLVVPHIIRQTTRFRELVHPNDPCDVCAFIIVMITHCRPKGTKLPSIFVSISAQSVQKVEIDFTFPRARNLRWIWINLINALA